jgi:hypothetical protein
VIAARSTSVRNYGRRAKTCHGSEFAVASGAAAGAGYCELRAKLDSTARWSGGRFFSSTPDTLSCQARYKLKDIPDPNHPGGTINPPFPAELFGDYDSVSC